MSLVLERQPRMRDKARSSQVALEVHKLRDAKRYEEIENVEYLAVQIGQPSLASKGQNDRFSDTASPSKNPRRVGMPSNTLYRQHLGR